MLPDRLLLWLPGGGAMTASVLLLVVNILASFF